MGADDIGRTAVTPHATTPHVATPQSTSLQATEIDHLRNDADLLRVIVDHTVDAIVRFDRSLRYDFVNDRSVQLTGVPRHRFLGATQADLGYPPDEVAIREERITKVFDSGEASSYHDVITNLEGERWYETTLLVIERECCKVGYFCRPDKLDAKWVDEIHVPDESYVGLRGGVAT